MADEYLTLSLDSGGGGDVKIKLRPDLAPGHVERIKELAGEGFYDGVKFHRVIPGFMAQGGCPNGTGMGGSQARPQAEFNAEPHVRGVCSMARTSAPHSANSQFFICFDDARLPRHASTPSGARCVSKAWNLIVDALPKGKNGPHPSQES
jgi:cyclophilin family peptidyl-prolyl cis-trans isomerase